MATRKSFDWKNANRHFGKKKAAKKAAKKTEKKGSSDAGKADTEPSGPIS